MEDTWLWKAIVGLLTLLVMVIGYVVRTHKHDHDKLKDDHAMHKLNISENYARKTDLNAARLEQTESVRRLHEKIEEGNEKLNDKIDAMPEKIVKILQRQ